ncbi:hypothetical protein [Caulobacter mirabilis]|uniref:Uncharacterized protein n=1 Tax=Caulobacter mirabilis TaxID=69666 RepID=A0A2D2AU02_9CAUL|nr:hypothetical protein [Caulobacter mirabilis]ATQ41492.1 hypothetical protein CSW64_03220 [Caulobacter mirabilis]
MRAKPKTTYVTASPATWELIRAAYLSGLSAPTAAARFGVSVGALRKRAQREGWTKRVHAAAPFALNGLNRPPGLAAPDADASPAAAVVAGAAATIEDAPADLALLHARALPPVRRDPVTVARMAAAEASRRLIAGDADAALRHIRAAEALVALDAKLEDMAGPEEDDDPQAAEARQSAFSEFTFQVAGELAGLLLTGRPVPPGYLARAEHWRAQYAACPVDGDEEEDGDEGE